MLRQVLSKLAANESNKERIVDCEALPYYVKLMNLDYTEVEQSEAAHGIWTLAFNEKCKERIRQENGCLEGNLRSDTLILCNNLTILSQRSESTLTLTWLACLFFAGVGVGLRCITRSVWSIMPKFLICCTKFIYLILILALTKISKYIPMNLVSACFL